MAIDPRNSVRRGQRLTISADHINFINRLMRGSAGLSGDPIGAQFSSPYTWVYCKNTTGATIARWGVIAITGVEITPTSDANAAATKQFEQMPVLTGGTPSATTTAWCVAIEPIESNKVGRVAVAGVVQCKVADLDNAHGACVLWKNSDWALLRMEGGVRLGTISSTWTKGSTATVTQIKADGSALSPTVTFTARNWFATVTVSTATKKVLCVLVGDQWILVSAEC